MALRLGHDSGSVAHAGRLLRGTSWERGGGRLPTRRGRRHPGQGCTNPMSRCQVRSGAAGPAARERRARLATPTTRSHAPDSRSRRPAFPLPAPPRHRHPARPYQGASNDTWVVSGCTARKRSPPIAGRRSRQQAGPRDHGRRQDGRARPGHEPAPGSWRSTPPASSRCPTTSSTGRSRRAPATGD